MADSQLTGQSRNRVVGRRLSIVRSHRGNRDQQCNATGKPREAEIERENGWKEEKKTRGRGMDDGQLEGDAGSIVIRLAYGSGVIPA